MTVDRSLDRSSGFTLIEVLIVVAIAAILIGISTPVYVDWRARELNSEAVSAVQRAVATTRLETKRTGVDFVMTFENNASTLTQAAGVLTIPNGGQIATVDGVPVTTTFTAPLGVQAPFGAVSFEVRTGQGALARAATVTIIPPLGKVAVAR